MASGFVPGSGGERRVGQDRDGRSSKSLFNQIHS